MFDKQIKYIDVSSGVCGDDRHASLSVWGEEGMSVFDDDEKTKYVWEASCGQCVSERIEELRATQ
ncbi:MAG TPA: hypothetical protein ENI23_06185 [bacterium]|nr:hypothetical protein [bacterium]